MAIIPIENRIYDTDFFGSGNPNDEKIIAYAGIQFTDVQKRIRYKQITIPYGKEWTAVATEVTVSSGNTIIVEDGDAVAMAITLGGII